MFLQKFFYTGCLIDDYISEIHGLIYSVQDLFSISARHFAGFICLSGVSVSPSEISPTSMNTESFLHTKYSCFMEIPGRQKGSENSCRNETVFHSCSRLPSLYLYQAVSPDSSSIPLSRSVSRNSRISSSAVSSSTSYIVRIPLSRSSKVTSD